MFYWIGKGIILGFCIAAPVGPIGILCIRRTLAGGRLSGFVTGLGAATADAFYGSVAAFGITAVSALLVDHHAWLQAAGGVFLGYLGISTMTVRPAGREIAAPERSLLGAYGSTLFLTLTNPMTIFSFAAVFAGLGITTPGAGAFAAAMVAGVFCGSALWWLTLSFLVSRLGAGLSMHSLTWVNRGSGLILFVFGIMALGSLII